MKTGWLGVPVTAETQPALQRPPLDPVLWLPPLLLTLL
jgi:hypothetical protein